MKKPIECVQFLPLYIHCVCYSFRFFVFFSLFIFLSFEILWVYLLQTLTSLSRPLWGTKWINGLVAYAKCNRDSYESELGL